MKIKSCSFNIFFSPIFNIRELLFEFENIITDFVKPFNLMAVPNEAPAEIPRISAISEHGHSSLLITPQNAVITVNFDQGFENDAEKCFKYVGDKKNSLVNAYNSILKTKTGMDILFSGLTTQTEFDEDELIVDPVEFIYKKFIIKKSKQNLEDVFIRFTHVLYDSFYINMEIQNVRSFNGMQYGTLMSTAGLKLQSHKIFVSLDINDRYSYNKQVDYTTKEDTIARLFSISENIVLNNLHDMIIKGDDLNYDGENNGSSGSFNGIFRHS